VALEELYPQQMRGYGEMDPKTASDLTWTLQESPVLENLLLPSFKGITFFAPFSPGTASQTFNNALLL
jgi:hypothetical protein